MKFKEIATTCPWRESHESPIAKTAYSCLGQASEASEDGELAYYECKAKYCAPFHFVQKMIPGGDDDNRRV